jgi:hypothetical protein
MATVLLPHPLAKLGGAITHAARAVTLSTADRGVAEPW